MDEYPSNSNNNKQEPKKIERIVEGEVIRRKKSVGKRFKEVFIGGNSKTVWGFVVATVLIPAAKNMIADASNTFVERMMFGESHHGSRRSSNRSNGFLGHVNYGHYSNYGNNSNSTSGVRRDESRNISHKARATHNFDEIVIPSRVEAAEVLDSLMEIIDKFREVSVSDFYEMVGVEAAHTDHKWGWTDLRGAGVTHVRGGFILNLPKPEHFD